MNHMTAYEEDGDMLRLDQHGVENKKVWEEAGFRIFSFDREAMRAATRVLPTWVHFGPGNIFRAFIAARQQDLLDQGETQSGIIAVAPNDGTAIEEIFRPHDDLSLLVTMQADGTLEKRVIGSIAEALVCNRTLAGDWKRLEDIFSQSSLQMASFTITEKGYKLRDAQGVYTAAAAVDLEQGPSCSASFMGRIAALLYRRFCAGGEKLALLSLDNCSHNGDQLKAPLLELAEQWTKRGLVREGFWEYLRDGARVAFPCSMIDKITPRPSEEVQAYLQKCGFADAHFVRTARGACYAPFVNAEKTEYLVIEDDFPNGRPPLEKTGVIFTDRRTVDRVERMKVCTCLNPLHTALAVFGCLLGYTKIADEMKDPLLCRLVERIGYGEGLPVAEDPGVLRPERFLREVLEERFPNPHIPDTPQRIASDTSQKVSVRFGETIQAYCRDAELAAADLTAIPLAIAGWLRYLLGVNDAGERFLVSPDPLLNELQKNLSGVRFGEPMSVGAALRPILSNREIFGCDLYAVGLGEKIEGYVSEMLDGSGAVRRALKKYVG